MKVKTYRAPTLKAALQQIKLELGPDALILAQKEIRPSGLLAGIGRKSVEVTAAIDYAQDQQAKPRAAAATSAPVVETPRAAVSPKPAPKPQRYEPPVVKPSEPSPVRVPEAPAEPPMLLEELRQLKALVQSMSQRRPQAQSVMRPQRFASSEAGRICSELLAAGVEENLIYETVLECDGRVADSEGLAEAVSLALSRRLHIEPDFAEPRLPGRPGVVALIGPTGVGKTTTLAKIAAKAALESRLKVGLITLDTYRIAAIEQLKTYAEILGIPVRVVENVAQMDLAIRGFAGWDLVLIDTAGMSPYELPEKWELAQFLSQSPTIRKALVLSATTRQSDLTEIVDRYEAFGPDCLIFTKLDETRSYGSIVNELVRTGKPLACVTTGQSVPQDMLRLESSQLVELVTSTDSDPIARLLMNQIPLPATSGKPSPKSRIYQAD